MAQPRGRHNLGRPPHWVLVVGSVFGGITLLFFMALIFMSLIGREVPQNSRFLVVVVMAFGAALASAFLGGHAAVNGTLPLPIGTSKGDVMKFSAVGGIGIFIIVMILGHALYAKSEEIGIIKVYGNGFPPPETKIYEQKCILARSAAETDALGAIARNAKTKVESTEKATGKVYQPGETTAFVNTVVSGALIVEEKPGKNCDSYTVIMSAPFQREKAR